MNIIFLGSGNFSVPSLKALLNSGHRISSVVTQPDKKKGRGLILSSTPVKALAERAGLKVYQPDKINSPQSFKFLRGLGADLFVIIAYGQILSQEALDIPKRFCLNMHASLLPKYRGAAPINRALINGEKISGITAMKVVKKMDSGPLIMQKEVAIKDNDTAITLEEKLALSAASLLCDTLDAIEKNSYRLEPQDEGKATFAPKLKKDDGLILFSKPALEICNLIRGCLPWPGAFTYYKGKLLKIYKAEVCPSARLPVCPSAGEIQQVSKEGIIVATGKDSLLIKELQLEGKRVISAQEFIAGHKISCADRLGK